MRGFEPKRWYAASIAVLLAVDCVPASAEDYPTHAAPWSGVRMALGLHADRWRPESTLTPHARPLSNCKRWWAAASRLGETYAGHLLRQTVIRRECRFLEADRAEETWDWPWASLSGGRVLPPRLHAALGEWEIRCGAAGTRRRCALLHKSPMGADQVLDLPDQAIVTHFVIDAVGGRESLLWRMFVPQASDTLAPAPPKRHSNGAVRYRLDEAERTEPFPACTATGCLMEANIRHAADVATRLWDGQPLHLHIRLRSDPPLDLTLPAAGFRAGLKELVRLRREEARAAGRR